MNTELTKWIKDTKRGFNILKSLKLNQLQILGDLAGLELKHYTNKTLLAKGIMIRLGTVLPREFSTWK